MLRITRLSLVAAVVLATLLCAATAFAAPTAWSSVDVALQSDEHQSMILVSGKLSPDASLPQDAELAVPAGAELQWIGEVLGGAATDDPELKYVKTTAGGMDVYRFTLTKARTAQVEAQITGVTGGDGTTNTTALKWTAWQAIPEVRIGQRVPSSAQIVQAAPGAALAPADTGFSIYSKVVQDVKAGDVVDLSFTHTVPVGAAAGAAAASTTAAAAATAPKGMSDAAVFLVIALFVGAATFVGYKLRGKLAAKSSPSGGARPHTGKPVRAAAASKKPSTARATREPVEVAPKKRISPLVPTIVVVAVLVVGALIAGAQGTSAKVTDGKITRGFGSTSECSSATIPVAAKQGVDLAKQGEKLLDSFEGQTGIGEVTVDVERSVVEIGFCESSQTEQSLRTLLENSGLVTTGGTSQEASATGS